MTKTLNRLLTLTVFILVIMSLLALIDINWRFMDSDKFSSSFTPKGIKAYLSGYSAYKSLFTGTIAIIAAYLGILRLKVANDAHKDKLKIDRFAEFKTILDILLLEVKNDNPYLKREFTKIRLELFNELYKLEFSIIDNDILTNLFNKKLNKIARFIEEKSDRYMMLGEIYKDKKHYYSFVSFQFIFQGCLDNSYDKFEEDLLNLYLGALNPDRDIDRERYITAVKNNSGIS